MLFKHRSLEKVDTFIIYACILSAVASSAWLIYDLTFNKFELNGQEPIGKISLVKNHVKRKFNRSLVWYDVAKQETVYENDWIFTGSASETQIELNEGGQLTVDPDSLIILTKKNGNIKLNLQHGSLIANVSSDVEINVLKDGKLEQVESNKLSGPVKIVQNETIAKPVPKEKPPAPKKVAKEILIQYPSDFETVWVKEGEAVSLEWTPDKNIKKYKLQLSQSQDFSKPITSNYSSNKAKLKIPKSGKYYWRVSDAENDKSKSPVYSFDVKINKEPAITMDVGEKSILKLTASKDGSVKTALAWKDLYKTWANYDIQIATDAEFNNIVAENKSPEQLYEFITKKGGTYFWRVRGISEDGAIVSSWSDRQMISIEVERGIEKKLSLAQNNITLNLSIDDLETIKDGKTVNKSFSIRWRSNFKAANYKVLISATKNFSSIHEEKVTKNQTIAFSSALLGESYFRVIAETENGNVDLRSAIGKIKTINPPPQRLADETSETEHYLKWAKIPGVDKYELIWTDKATGKETVVYTTTNSFKLAKQDSSFFWKVRGVNSSNNDPTTPFSKKQFWEAPEKVLASVEPGLPPPRVKNRNLFPVITKPAKRKTYVAPGNSPIFFILEWDFAPDADFFDVEISKTPDMQNIIFKKKIQGKNKAVINQSFPPGKYYMRILAKENNKAKAWSDVEVFRVLDKEE